MVSPSRTGPANREAQLQAAIEQDPRDPRSPRVPRSPIPIRSVSGCLPKSPTTSTLRSPTTLAHSLSSRIPIATTRLVRSRSLSAATTTPPRKIFGPSTNKPSPAKMSGSTSKPPPKMYKDAKGKIFFAQPPKMSLPRAMGSGLARTSAQPATGIAVVDRAGDMASKSSAGNATSASEDISRTSSRQSGTSSPSKVQSIEDVITKYCFLRRPTPADIAERVKKLREEYPSDSDRFDSDGQSCASAELETASSLVNNDLASQIQAQSIEYNGDGMHHSEERKTVLSASDMLDVDTAGVKVTGKFLNIEEDAADEQCNADTDAAPTATVPVVSRKFLGLSGASKDEEAVLLREKSFYDKVVPCDAIGLARPERMAPAKPQNVDMASQRRQLTREQLPQKKREAKLAKIQKEKAEMEETLGRDLCSVSRSACRIVNYTDDTYDPMVHGMFAAAGRPEDYPADFRKPGPGKHGRKREAQRQDEMELLPPSEVIPWVSGESAEDRQERIKERKKIRKVIEEQEAPVRCCGLSFI